jgi:hypothetical protein
MQVRRDQIAQQQAAQQQKMLMDAADTLKAQMPTFKTKDQYDQAVAGFGRMIGLRPGAENVFRQMAPYSEPNVQKRAEVAASKLFSNPMTKDALTPDVLVDFDRDGDGMPERIQLSELMTLAQIPMVRDEKTGQITFGPKGSKLGDRFTEKLGSDLAVFQAEKNREPTPQERQGIVDGAIKATAELQRAPKISVTVPGGLPTAVQRRVDAQSKGFDSQQIVKRTQTMAEAASFASSLDPNTKNPADDQALIYAFAKAMDPESVVREGEYATVQKYAQSWAQTFGFNTARLFTNSEFLTPQARANMKKTIMARYAAARGQYDNVRKSYEGRINKITGGTDAADYLTDYAGAFPEIASETTAPAAPTGEPPAVAEARRRRAARSKP